MGENVVDLMDALKRNIANKGRSRTRGNAAANEREARCES
jgi:non-homologous end joining protein Ku